MEAHGLAPGMAACERPEPRERARRVGLVEPPDGHRHLWLEVVRRQGGGRLELAQRRKLVPEPLQRDAVQELVADASGPGAAGEEGDLPWRRQPVELGRRPKCGHEAGQAAGEVRMEEVLGPDRVGRVRLRPSSGAPRRLGGGGVSTPVEGKAVVELDDRAARGAGREGPERREPVRPCGEVGSDRGLDRVLLPEDQAGLVRLAGVV